MYQPFAFMGGAEGLEPVTDGLLFYVDSKDYPGSGTTWTDNQGLNDMTLVNSPTYTSGDDGYFTATATNQAATGSNGEHVLPTTANATFSIEFLVYPTAVTARYGATINYWGNDSNNNQSWWFGHNNSGGFHVNMRDAGNSLNYNSAASAMSNNNWYHVVFACELGSTMDIYRNGSAYATGISLSSIVQFDRTSGGTGGFMSLWKQSQTTSTNTMLGRMATARAYNIKLDSTQVTQNYNYFQSRGYDI